MSDTWAIAAVTKSLTKLLERAATDDPSFSPLDVVSKPPDRVLTDDANLARRKLNLFLYQVARNPALANADLPFRNGGGNTTDQPIVSLDLYYLLTAYGRTHDELDAQHLLAHALSLVHDNGVLRRQHIAASLSGTPMAASGLADQFERLAVTHIQLSDEDLFRMWTVFGSPYRISTGFCASVVLVQRTKPSRKAPPVRRAGLTVATPRRPIAESLDLQRDPATGITKLSIHGLNLSADEVLLRLPAGDFPPDLVGDELITLALPGALRAGPNTVQVVHRIELSGGAGTRPFAVSDVIPFSLRPSITSALPAAAPRGGQMTVTVAPPVHRSQQVLALLGSQAIERRLLATDPESSSTLGFDIPASLSAGDVPLRVQVDGAESELTPDAGGAYVNPKATVT